MAKKPNFYLGRIYDTVTGETTDQRVEYDPDDLTTHGVVVGMTGSGKTGLCIGILEEAALHKIPALMIDPKGDITNTLLHFPEMSAEDFLLWVNPDEARKKGISKEEYAAAEAAKWSKGLASHGIGKKEIQQLTNSVDFSIYTPGSDAGIPINILGSLKAPSNDSSDREAQLEKISGTATALLGLLGLEDIDPIRSREHILLTNLFQSAWTEGKDLDLGELILMIQNPPFEKLGVFELEQFYPGKDRMDLAFQLNNILAAPTFEFWLQGQELDIEALLYSPDRKPRHSIFYLAHLNDQERMFFVTLLYTAVEAWMRQQTGTTSLRALMYFDEIHGYLPPVSMPASKPIMLRMLKQGRAYGVSQLLATQNPSDLDYKALSNAGTWFIGRLQTEQDKDRLLDGLSDSAGGLDKKAYDNLISSLDSRQFVLHNVHEDEPIVFYTRWVMNYLAGPMTRKQIPALNALAGTTKVAAATPVKSQAANTSQEVRGSNTRPKPPAGIDEFFLRPNLNLTKAAEQARILLPAELKDGRILYKPYLFAQAKVRINKSKYKINSTLSHTIMVDMQTADGSFDWEDFNVKGLEDRDLSSSPERGEVQYASLESPFTAAAKLKYLHKDFANWSYYASEVAVMANETLKVYAGPPATEGDFRKMCTEAAAKLCDTEIDKIEASFKRKIDAIKKRLVREERELKQDEDEYNQRKLEEAGTHLENVVSLFTKRRKSLTTSLTKRRMTAKAKADIEESEDAILEFQSEIKALEAEVTDEIDEIEDKWAEIVSEQSEILVQPYKKDVLIENFGIAWKPFFVVQIDDQISILDAFGKSS